MEGVWTQNYTDQTLFALQHHLEVLLPPLPQPSLSSLATMLSDPKALPEAGLPVGEVDGAANGGAKRRCVDPVPGGRKVPLANAGQVQAESKKKELLHLLCGRDQELLGYSLLLAMLTELQANTVLSGPKQEPTS